MSILIDSKRKVVPPERPKGKTHLVYWLREQPTIFSNGALSSYVGRCKNFKSRYGQHKREPSRLVGENILSRPHQMILVSWCNNEAEAYALELALYTSNLDTPGFCNEEEPHPPTTGLAIGDARWFVKWCDTYNGTKTQRTRAKIDPVDDETSERYKKILTSFAYWLNYAKTTSDRNCCVPYSRYTGQRLGRYKKNYGSFALTTKHAGIRARNIDVEIFASHILAITNQREHAEEFINAFKYAVYRGTRNVPVISEAESLLVIWDAKKTPYSGDHVDPFDGINIKHPIMSWVVEIYHQDLRSYFHEKLPAVRKLAEYDYKITR